MHEFLHFVVFPARFVINIDNAEAKLFRATIHTAPAEKKHVVTASRHRLIGPELRLFWARQIANVVVSLCAHELLDDPEILLFQSANIVQRHGDFCRFERFFQPAPDRIIVIGDEIQLLGHDVLIVRAIKKSAEQVVRHLLMRPTMRLDQINLHFGKGIDTVRAKTRPVQTQRRIVRGHGMYRHGNLRKISVGLSPEYRAVGFVQSLDVLFVHIAQIILKRQMTLLAVALIGAFVADLVVHLPRNDGGFVRVVFDQFADDFFGVLLVHARVETILSPPAKHAHFTIHFPCQNRRMRFRQPRRKCRRRRTKHHAQAMRFGFGNHLIKKREIKLPFNRLHFLPSKFTDTNDVAAHLAHPAHIIVHHLDRPMLGVIVNA